MLDLAFPEIFLMGMTAPAKAAGMQPIDEVNYDRSFYVQAKKGFIHYDSEVGAGATPDNLDVAYLGFAALIDPRDFLAASFKLQSEDRSPRTLKHLQEVAFSTGWAPPRLYLERTLTTDPNDARFAVVDHEGRHRALTAIKLGAKAIPVHFYVRNARARNLKPDDLDAIARGVVRQDAPRAVVPLPFSFALLQNQKYVLAP